MANAGKSSSKPAPNGRVVGRYLMFGQIGSGGTATVHFGRLRGQGGFARTVALKRLHSHLARDPYFVQLFLSEARLAARVSHPNVTSLLDVVRSDDGDLLLVMDYVHGETLAGLLGLSRRREAAIPVRIATAIIVGALAGLHAAHEALGEDGRPLGLVHGDVSPHNVIVGVDGMARMLDFGVARAGAATSKDRRVIGTLAYMAPERLRGTSFDRRSDVFGAGVLLWEMLATRRLFSGCDGRTKRALAQIPPPSHFRPGIPSALDDAILSALRADENERPQDALAFAQMLESTVAPASNREIADWLQLTAGARLRERAEELARIEKSSVPPLLEEGDFFDLPTSSNQGDAARPRPATPTTLKVTPDVVASITDDEPTLFDAELAQRFQALIGAGREAAASNREPAPVHEPAPAAAPVPQSPRPRPLHERPTSPLPIPVAAAPVAPLSPTYAVTPASPPPPPPYFEDEEEVAALPQRTFNRQHVAIGALVCLVGFGMGAWLKNLSPGSNRPGGPALARNAHAATLAVNRANETVLPPAATDAPETEPARPAAAFGNVAANASTRLLPADDAPAVGTEDNPIPSRPSAPARASAEPEAAAAPPPSAAGTPVAPATDATATAGPAATVPAGSLVGTAPAAAAPAGTAPAAAVAAPTPSAPALVTTTTTAAPAQLALVVLTPSNVPAALSPAALTALGASPPPAAQASGSTSPAVDPEAAGVADAPTNRRARPVETRAPSLDEPPHVWRERVIALNRRALAAYDRLELERAHEDLQLALRHCAKVGRFETELTALTHSNLGVVLAGGFKQRGLAVRHFRKARALLPSISPPVEVSNPEIQAALKEAGAARGAL